MARAFLEPETPLKVRAHKSALLAEKFPSLVAMAKDTGPSICDIPFAPNPGADWLHVPFFSVRSCMFEAVSCNGALADLFMYSSTLGNPVVESKLITANSCVKGRPHISYLYRAGFYFLSASGYHYQAEWYPGLKTPLVFILRGRSDTDKSKFGVP